ncbi:MAG: leucine-rich repeat domain-containing protein [Pseudanabaenaceae cyanobacterium bins.39]|nr:leucine-rich repeat domain-containing protein [Pseudanabaenaceae cyanobacterium bins.39]
MRTFPLSVLATIAFIASFPAFNAEASPKTFEQWCQQKDSLSAGAKNTVEALLKQAETQDCKVANQKLNSFDEISITFGSITDFEPIATLTNLTALYLIESSSEGVDRIEITDLSPLSKLPKLTNLFLWNSQIKDVRQFTKLTGLTNLSLNDNGLSDVSPIAKLTKLEYLDLRSNQITDVTPLTSLPKLEYLDLVDNPLKILKPLSSLKSLKFLNLSKTQFKPADCPSQPASICHFF